MIKVVNKKHYKGKGFYIGRGSPLGNPFSSKKSKYNTILCKTPQESIVKYRDYY